MDKILSKFKPFGKVYYKVYTADGEEKRCFDEDNKIVAGMIDNIVRAFSAETHNPCSGYEYVALGSGDTPVTVNDTELDDEFETGDFGGSNYDTRLKSYANSDYSANSYTVSAGITNESDDTLTVSETGLFNSETPGSTSSSASMGSRTVVGTPVFLEPDEKLEITWVWSVNSD